MQVFMLSSVLFLASPVCKFVTRTVTPSDGVLTRNNSSLCHTMAHLPHNIDCHPLKTFTPVKLESH